MDRDAEKRAAAQAAVAMVEDGMVIGLGTGSTAHFAVEALISRVRAGLRIRAIPTSERTADQARAGGIPLTSFAEHHRLDLTIDGADEIELGTLNLIKGLGGALLREKIVAVASARLVIVADHEKLVNHLGAKSPVPVEVVPFGWETTANRLRQLGAEPQPRRDASGQLFCTDGGNRILDCRFRAIPDPAGLDRLIGQTVGVVETGLFIGMTEIALIADDNGVRTLRPDRPGLSAGELPQIRP
ncbi:MAG TPA: ribose-5-phosphate isomerase RpiA [Acetobacteraceae bacterium]|nr:ribose-5-phosphate isomerase RpiA [Acetobacteraceae bacterium]